MPYKTPTKTILVAEPIATKAQLTAPETTAEAIAKLATLTFRAMKPHKRRATKPHALRITSLDIG
jgi:hypothetical protein